MTPFDPWVAVVGKKVFCTLSKKVLRCPWLKGGRKEGGREEMLGKPKGGKPVFLGLGFVVFGFMPQRKEGFAEAPLMGEKLFSL